MIYPFEVPSDVIEQKPGEFVDAVFSSLVSEFLVLPKGEGFLQYGEFSRGYECLKAATDGFTRLDRSRIFDAVVDAPVSLVVLRTILGFTPPEWAYLASAQAGVSVPQGAVRQLDRDIRLNPLRPLRVTPTLRPRLAALIGTACDLIAPGSPPVQADAIHRLNKADTLDGLSSVQNLAEIGVPYAMLLYERFLGRPFAGHRDSVSELVGEGLESAIEGVLQAAGVSFRKTRRAERLAGFEQAPDFIIPDEFHPKVVIEAKITEDDGTARDKASRIIRLCEMAATRQRESGETFQVVACLAGRGFGVRREDMRQIIQYTKGKVFTPKTLDRLIENTAIREFRSRYA